MVHWLYPLVIIADPIQAAIEAQMAALLDGFSRDDVNAILDVYVEDVKALFHGQEQITGKQGS